MPSSRSLKAHSLTTCRIHDNLLTRLSNDDDLEKSLSTFANEMASSAMILGEFSLRSVVNASMLTGLPAGLATENSLVLIDEVGRGTSVREGIGISHAIAEELIRLKVIAFSCLHPTLCLIIPCSLSSSSQREPASSRSLHRVRLIKWPTKPLQ